MNYVAYPGISIYYDEEIEEVFSFNSVQKPDPAWKFLDKEGHLHSFVDGKLPTLEEVVIGKTWVGDEWDGQEVEHRTTRCKLCGEEVKPKFNLVSEPNYIRGIPRYTLELGGHKYPIDEKDIGPFVEILQRCGVIKK